MNENSLTRRIIKKLFLIPLLIRFTEFRINNEADHPDWTTLLSGHNDSYIGMQDGREALFVIPK